MLRSAAELLARFRIDGFEVGVASSQTKPIEGTQLRRDLHALGFGGIDVHESSVVVLDEVFDVVVEVRHREVHRAAQEALVDANVEAAAFLDLELGVATDGWFTKRRMVEALLNRGRFGPCAIAGAELGTGLIEPICRSKPIRAYNLTCVEIIQ